MSNTQTRLLQWRLDTGLSQQEVADLTGFTKTMIGRVERGEAHFSPLARVRVARALGVPVATLFPAPETVGLPETK